MDIVITGANGQLGREFQDVLSLGRADIGALPGVYEGARITCVGRDDLDISDETAVDAFMEGLPCDLIVNCAAMTDVDRCESDVLAARQANSVGPQVLALAARAHDCKLVHISTDYVFDGKKDGAYVETDVPNPQTVYGKSKLEGELLVSNILGRHIIVRTSWLYGLHGGNFVKTMLRLAHQNGAIKVVDDQRGNPTYANDLVYEVLKIAASDVYGTFHCTSEGVCSWYEFACAIVEEAGIPCEKVPCTSEEFPRPAKRPAYSALENRHLADTVGNEMRPWRDALKNYLAKLA